MRSLFIISYFSNIIRIFLTTGNVFFSDVAFSLCRHACDSYCRFLAVTSSQRKQRSRSVHTCGATTSSLSGNTWERLWSVPSGKYLVVVQVVGKTSDEELVRGVGNDGGDDACRDEEQTQNICRGLSLYIYIKIKNHAQVRCVGGLPTGDVERRLLRDSR